jgi:hypothetical protein
MISVTTIAYIGALGARRKMPLVILPIPAIAPTAKAETLPNPKDASNPTIACPSTTSAR